MAHAGGGSLRRPGTGMLLAGGIILILAGTAALVFTGMATLLSTVILGWMVLGAGVLQVVTAFGYRDWSGFLLHLLLGAMFVVSGAAIVANPGAAAATLTLIFAVFLVMGGLFRLLAGATHRMPHRGWVILNGAVSLFLGLMVWSEWPVSGLWVIGLVVGIEMVMAGWSYVALALALRAALAARPGSAQ